MAQSVARVPSREHNSNLGSKAKNAKHGVDLKRRGSGPAGGFASFKKGGGKTRRSHALD